MPASGVSIREHLIGIDIIRFSVVPEPPHGMFAIVNLGREFELGSQSIVDRHHDIATSSQHPRVPRHGELGARTPRAAVDRDDGGTAMRGLGDVNVAVQLVPIAFGVLDGSPFLKFVNRGFLRRFDASVGTTSSGN